MEDSTTTYYACTGGCQGVSNVPGKCQAASCPNYQQELVPHKRGDDGQLRPISSDTDTGSDDASIDSEAEK